MEQDMINQPPHYKTHPMECIDEMLVAFGEKAVFFFCICNAWKYRYRAGSKGNAEEDLAKSDWYMNMAKEIKGHLEYPGDLYDNDVR